MNEYFKGLVMLGSIKAFDYIKYHFPQITFKMLYKSNMILEAIGEGVVVNPLQHCAAVDCFAALRPQIEKEQLFQSIINALENYGKPYDFLFDFESDDALVCSELIYKSYRSTQNNKAIDFSLSTLYGKPFLSPNDIAKQFCSEKESLKHSFSLVLFYDGNEKIKKAMIKDEQEFCNRANE
jgi:uncharacterized protein YycO